MTFVFHPSFWRSFRIGILQINLVNSAESYLEDGLPGRASGKSPGYLRSSPSKWPNSMAEINGGDPLATYKSWDAPST